MVRGLLFLFIVAASTLITACAPPCDVTTRGEMEHAWCPGSQLSIQPVNDACAAETQRAINWWQERGFDVSYGSSGDEVVELLLTPDLPEEDDNGFTYSTWEGNVLTSSEIKVRFCNDLLIVHEIGHAMGLRHENTKGNVMYPYLKGELKDSFVAEKQVADYKASRK